MSFFSSGSFGGFFSAPSGGGAPASATLDAPITTALSSSTLGAYGLSRMVEGYSGNTVRLSRRSDSAESDFGLNATGSLDTDAVDTWRASADVDVVKLYDQKNSNDLSAVGRARLIDGGNYVRMGVTRNSSTEVLTRSTTLGGVGIDTGSDLSYFISDSGYTLTSSEGVEAHYAFSIKEDIDSTYSGEQYIVAFGHSDNEYFNHGVGPASAVDYIRCKTTSGNSVESQTIPYKANGLHVQSLVMDGATNFELYGHGVVDTQAMAAGIITDIGTNDFTGSKLVVGAKFTGSSGAIRSDRRANMVFAGVVLTKHLSGDAGNLNRWLIGQKLQAICYEHRIQTKATIRGYFDGMAFMKDIETSGYTVSPVTGTGTIEYNRSVANGGTGTPDFDHEYVLPKFGLQGVRAVTENNDNAWVSDDAVPPDGSGTVVSFHFPESISNDLCQVVGIASDTQGEFDTTLNGVSYGLGYDHGGSNMRTRMASDRDDDSLMGDRLKADESAFGYDLDNQAMGKYNDKTAHEEMTYNETYDSHVWDIDDWQNAGDQPYDLDAPVTAPLAGNNKSLTKDSALTLHIGTFKKPTGYNKADAYATRKGLRLQSENYSYVSQGAIPSMRWGDIAYTANGGVVDNSTDAKLMSRGGTGTYKPFQGVYLGKAWSSTVFDTTKVEETVVNIYKEFE